MVVHVYFSNAAMAMYVAAPGRLLADLFDSGAVGTSDEHWGYNHVVWTPFIFAAVACKLKVLKFLAAREDVDVHWRSLGGNNAYANVLERMESDVELYEEHEFIFPSDGVFDDVRPGETHAQYVARARERVEAEYEPVLTYLRDELGLNTRPPRCSSPSAQGWVEESEEEEGEEEEEDEEEGEGMVA